MLAMITEFIFSNLPVAAVVIAVAVVVAQVHPSCQL